MAEDLLEEYRTGVFTLKIDNKPLKVKPKNSEKLKIRALDKKMSKLFKNNASDDDIESVDKEKCELLKEIIKRGDSRYTDEIAENLLMAKQNDIEEELGIAFGWYTRKHLDSIKAKQMKKIEEDIETEEGDKGKLIN